MLTPTQKEEARLRLRRYCERAEGNKNQIHYMQIRPMEHFGISPNNEFITDCSGFVTGAYRWADIYTTFPVHDPNGLSYSGYGYTGTLLSHNKMRRVPLDRKFYIGDMGIYGPSLSNTKHVVICRRGGTLKTAIWTSHGSEAGPYPVKLLYRKDLLVVVRSQDLV